MEDLKKYLTHLPTCSIMQNWSEAEQAMADTPQRFRDEGWHLAYDEMRRKQNTCTCGMDTIEKNFYPKKFIVWITINGRCEGWEDHWLYDYNEHEGVYMKAGSTDDLFEYWKQEVME